MFTKTYYVVTFGGGLCPASGSRHLTAEMMMMMFTKSVYSKYPNKHLFQCVEVIRSFYFANYKVSFFWYYYVKPCIAELMKFSQVYDFMTSHNEAVCIILFHLRIANVLFLHLRGPNDFYQDF